MNRRHLLSLLAAAPLVSRANAASNWSAKFINGAFDGKTYSAGLHIKLAPEWKTYWRNPGVAGIPPSITAPDASNLASLDIDYPLPKRISNNGDEAFGYHDEVLFPLRLKATDVGAPMSVRFSAFFGVCEKVCTPAKLETMLNFTPKSPPSPDMDLIKFWQAQVPMQASIASVATIQDGILKLKLNNAYDDIFVEGSEMYYFRAPDFKKESGSAFFKIDGIKADAELKGANLRITADQASNGLEQMITVA